MAVKVLPNNRVEHDGKPYEAGEVITDIKDNEAQALVDSGVAVNADAKSGQPSEEEVAKTADEAGQTTEQKKGLFR